LDAAIFTGNLPNGGKQVTEITEIGFTALGDLIWGATHRWIWVLRPMPESEG